MRLEHVNGATRARSDGWAEWVGMAGDTGGAVYLAYTAHPFDPARGDWLEHDELDPDAVVVVAASCLVPEAVRASA